MYTVDYKRGIVNCKSSARMVVIHPYATATRDILVHCC